MPGLGEAREGEEGDERDLLSPSTSSKTNRVDPVRGKKMSSAFGEGEKTKRTIA